jgi:hypothetical protein
MARAKKKVSTKPRVRGNKVVGPSFEGYDKLEPSAFHKLYRSAFSFYYEEYKKEDLAKEFFVWMKTYGYSDSDIKYAKAGASILTTPYIYARLLSDGCPDYNKSYASWYESMPGVSGKVRPITDFLKTQVDEMISKGMKKKDVDESDENKPKAAVVKPTIQQIVFQQVLDVLVDVDEWLDTSFDKKFSVDSFDVKSHLISNNMSQVHCRKIIKIYEGEIQEFNELLNPPSVKTMTEKEKDLFEQLKEGYSHLTKAKVKNRVAALDKVIAACNFIIESASANRKPRKPKVRSADAQVKAIKYLKNHPGLNLVSINPVDIIGANELWVYNVKTRKIGRYIASNPDPKGTKRTGSGLSVKGTTLQGFDESASVQKTLRKPEESLKRFKDSGKVALRKFMDTLTTTESSLNGRINADTIILKAV